MMMTWESYQSSQFGNWPSSLRLSALAGVEIGIKATRAYLMWQNIYFEEQIFIEGQKKGRLLYTKAVEEYFYRWSMGHG